MIFCMLTAVGIGWVTRQPSTSELIGADSAIGIFLSAGLAWGFAALAIYNRHSHGVGGSEESWEKYLFGSIDLVPANILVAGTAISLLVVICVGLFLKEIIAYAFNPLLAEVTGVRVGFVHYMLMLLIAVTIVVGMRIAGNVSITALLILPGSTALLLSRKLPVVFGLAVGFALIAAVGGVIFRQYFFHGFPGGPAIVLLLVAEFVVVLIGTRVFQRS